MELHDVWFVLIAVLWTGYFFLEGFDFGVGILLPAARPATDAERRVLINTIGPVWDGNEVWLLTAGGATFAAFPEWYATLFSGFYLPLLLILVCLIVRGVAFEYRAQAARGALAAPLGARDLLGPRCSRRSCGAWPSPTSCAACRSTPTTSTSAPSGTCSTRTPCSAAWSRWRCSPSTARCSSALKTVGDIRERARRARRCGSALVAAVLALAFLVWTQVRQRRRPQPGRARSWPSPRWSPRWRPTGRAARAGRSRCSGVTIAAAVAMLFLALFPDVMPSTLDAGWQPDGRPTPRPRPYTLKIMTWVRGDRHPARAALPGLDLLGVPQADRHAAHRRRGTGRRLSRHARSGVFHVKPVDPRLLRYARATRVFLAGGRRPGRRRRGAGRRPGDADRRGGGRRLPARRSRRRPAHARCCCWPPSPSAGRWSPGSPSWPRTGRAPR